ncbi:MAG: GDSL-type esterase/lipase family protein [Myxococcota bacterium]
MATSINPQRQQGFARLEQRGDLNTNDASRTNDAGDLSATQTDGMQDTFSSGSGVRGRRRGGPELFARTLTARSSATADDFSRWQSYGPRQYNVRRAALNAGMSYTRVMRDFQAGAPRKPGPNNDYQDVLDAAAAMPYPRNERGDPSVSRAQFKALIAQEQRAMSGYTGPLSVLYGDSNTHAPFEIFARASEGPHILNHAISGLKTDEILQNILDMEPVDNPGKAIISGGTNDLRALYANGNKPNINTVNGVIDDIIENKKQSIFALLGRNGQEAKNPNARIFLTAVLPAGKHPTRGTDTEIPQSVIRTLNSRIKKLAADAGVTYIDVHTPFMLTSDSVNGRAGEANPLHTTDGIHLNGPAAYEMGRLLGLY